MYQPPINSIPQGQSKKSTGRNRQLEGVSTSSHLNGNEKTKKNVPLQTAVINKATPRKPSRNNSRQISTGPRERSFSKNERKFESKNIKQAHHSSMGSEKFAIQDLLNFQYSSGRNNVDTNNHYRGYRSTRKKASFFNKEEYLQAKCQFVVIGTVDDYSINAVNPDKLVDWDKVHLVYLPSHDPPNCPICLYPPIAGKITRCGHTFCWSCILHYLHLGDKAWRKCPICHEAVHKKDLKSVKAYTQTKYARLDSISMKLMKRSKESILVFPKCESVSHKVEFPSWSGNSFYTDSKIMLATPQQVVKEILMKERDELRMLLANDMADENGEATFISMALEILEEEIKSFNLEEIAQASDCNDGGGGGEIDAHASMKNISLSSVLSDTYLYEKCIVEAAFSDDEQLDSNTLEMREDAVEATNYHGRVSESSYVSNEQSLQEVPNIDLGQSPTSEYGEHKQKDSDSYFFYQAEDRQNIFLHSVNARCLIEEYGSLDYGPIQIRGQIIDFEWYTMTKELRKRFRYLRHLPLSSEFMICELILKPPLLSKHTIHNFMPEFKNRKALRLKKFKEQQKFDRQAVAFENKQHGFHVDAEYDDDIGIDLSNTEEFPSSLSPECYEKEIKEDVAEDEDQGMLSFAQMLSKKVDVDKMCQKVERTPIYKTVQGHGIASIPYSNTVNSEDDEPEIVAPDFKDTFSAAMFASPMQKENPVSSKGKNSKKKREKGMLLFATGGQRKY